MTDQPLTTGVDSNILRLLIREAVEREVSTMLAPLRTQIQVQEGMLKQFNRDVLVLQNQAGDLDELVRGNPKQNLIGLADQIKSQNSLLETLRSSLTNATVDMQRQVQASIVDIKKELGAKVDAVETKQDEATKMREALINQWRGAKYAIFALGIITGLPYLETVARLLRLIP